MLVLLESLSPEQRAVLLLHSNVFDYGYPQIAAIVGKSEDKCASSRPAPGDTSSNAGPASRRRASTRRAGAPFFAAAEQGDLAGLEALLAHDVELTGDGGGKAPAIARTLRGRSRVARHCRAGYIRISACPGIALRPVEINGGPPGR